MTTPPTHDALGRHVQTFLAGEAACGLPRAPALLAYARAHHRHPQALAQVRLIVVIVERAEQPSPSAKVGTAA
jgi:hypothetical protein